MVVRRSISLPDDLLRRLEAIARSRGLSVNAVNILAIEREVREAEDASAGPQRGDMGHGASRRA